MLKSMNCSDYHTFRVNYWDWRYSNRAEVFTADRLGANTIGNRLSGHIVDAGWDTICWYNGSGNVTAPKGTICDPRINTGPVQRCPIIDGVNPCEIPDNWPTAEDVEDALSVPLYDTEPFNREVTESFRNLMEGNKPGFSEEDCNFCLDGILILNHNAVSGL